MFDVRYLILPSTYLRVYNIKCIGVRFSSKFNDK